MLGRILFQDSTVEATEVSGMMVRFAPLLLSSIGLLLCAGKSAGNVAIIPVY